MGRRFGWVCDFLIFICVGLVFVRVILLFIVFLWIVSDFCVGFFMSRWFFSWRDVITTWFCGLTFLGRLFYLRTVIICACFRVLDLFFTWLSWGMIFLPKVFIFIPWVFSVHLIFSLDFLCCRHFRVVFWGRKSCFWVKVFIVFVFGFFISFTWGLVNFIRFLFIRFRWILFFVACLWKWAGRARLIANESGAWVWCFARLLFIVIGFILRNRHFRGHLFYL